MGKASQRKRRERKKSRLDPAFVRSQRPSLSIQDYLDADDLSPEILDKYQRLVPRDLANAVYRLIDGDMFEPREDINRACAHLPYDVRLILSYRPAMAYVATTLGSQSIDTKGVIKLAFLILSASRLSPMARRFDV